MARGPEDARERANDKKTGGNSKSGANARDFANEKGKGKNGGNGGAKDSGNGGDGKARQGGDTSLHPRQVFFPMAVDDEGWAKLAGNLRAEIDSETDRKVSRHGVAAVRTRAAHRRETRLFTREPEQRKAGYVRASEKSCTFDDRGVFIELPLVNQIRPRVKAWREADCPGATGITKRLLQHWRFLGLFWRQ